MPLTRRQSLFTAGAATALGLAGGARARLASARGLLVDGTLDEVVHRALEAAKKAGASYADVRLVRRREEMVSARESHISGLTYEETYGLGVRVVAKGAWGFAASPLVNAREAGRVAEQAVAVARANARVIKRPVTLVPVPAHVDVWQTPLVKDPFKVPVDAKAELLLAINKEAMQVKGVRFINSWCQSIGEWKLFASTDGGYLEQNVVRVGPGYRVTAPDARTGEFVTRDHDLQPMQAGWEYVERAPLLADARRIGEEAVEKLRSPGVAPGKKDLILAPSNLWLTIHESVGHPTELDRALGYEANYAGTSFATPDKLGKLQYGASIVNIYADKITPGALATCGYDDDGVKTQRWDLIKDGVFVGYQTTRDQAGWIGEKESRGTSYAQDHASIPFQRMPNVSLAPGKKDLGVKDLIAATDDGIYIVGRGSWSIDHQRYNFQFGGQMFHEIKKGKITRTLKDVAYQSNSIQFWNACDLIGGQREWELGGSMQDGKGEPPQINAVSHGCAPARFRGVEVLNTNQRGRA